MTVLKRWLNPDELAAEFGIAKSTQALKRKQKVIPYSKQGNFVFYDRRKIDAWLEQHTIVDVNET